MAHCFLSVKWVNFHGTHSYLTLPSPCSVHRTRQVPIEWSGLEVWPQACYRLPPVFSSKHNGHIQGNSWKSYVKVKCECCLLLPLTLVTAPPIFKSVHRSQSPLASSEIITPTKSPASCANSLQRPLGLLLPPVPGNPDVFHASVSINRDLVTQSQKGPIGFGVADDDFIGKAINHNYEIMKRLSVCPCLITPS